MLISKSTKTILLVTVLLFAFLFPLSNYISFPQNDDWVYYLTTKDFSDGNTVLHPYIGPTFYLQGLIGAGFSRIFGLEKLPVLTLIFSLGSFFIFCKILSDFFKLKDKIVILLGLLFFFNPINIYLVWGYMTGQYFMPFLLLGIYMFLKFEMMRLGTWDLKKSSNNANNSQNKLETLKNYKYLIASSLITLAGLFVRQVALVLPLSISIYYVTKKELKLAAINFGVFTAYYLLYDKVIPLTDRIREVPLQLQHLTKLNYSMSLIFGILVYMVAFLMPIFLILFINNIKELKKINFKKILWSIIGISIFALFLNKFEPQAISWGEFPYFENTFERTGFYPRGIGGIKYGFYGIYDLYKYWNLASLIILGIFAAYLPTFKSKILNFFTIYIVTYVGLMIVTETFYDRYMIMIIPITILSLVEVVKNGLNTKLHFEKLINYILLGGFTLFLTFLSYQFSMDFLLSNKYVWEKSEELAMQNNIEKYQIQGTNAWKLSYKNFERGYIYNFSYDSPEVNEGYECCYNVVEIKEIEFPLNLFMNSKIHLYKMK